MEKFEAADLELLTDEQWWTSAPLFEIWFDFQNQNSLKVFQPGDVSEPGRAIDLE